MQRQPHSGVAIAGAITISPPLGEAEIDQVELISLLTNHESLRDGLGATVDAMLPGRPDGPSGWATCDEGCCLEVVSPYMRPESIAPWLGYLITWIETSSCDERTRRYGGSLVVWNSANRSFDALWVEGTTIRQGRLQHPERQQGRAPVVALERRRA